jgi:hypothetical protein
MPKTHRGSMIGGMFVADKMIVLTFLNFLDPDKVHRSSTINYFFMSFVNVYHSHIFPVPKGIDYLLKLHVNNLRKPTPPSTDADGNRHLATVVTMWSLA